MKSFNIFTSLMIFISFSAMAKTFKDLNVSVQESRDSQKIQVQLQVQRAFGVESTEIAGEVFSRINWADGREIMEKGFPAVRKIHLLFHTQTNRNYDLRVTDCVYDERDYSADWLPARGVIYRDQDPGQVPLAVAPESLVDRFYPYDFRDFVKNGSHFLIGSVRGRDLDVVLWSVNALRKKVRILKSLSFELVASQSRVIENPAPAHPFIYSADIGILPALFQNFRWTGEISDEKGELLVLYTARDASAIQPYVVHKQNLGFTVHTKQVATGTNVKPIIQSEYTLNNKILYVLNVGDWPDLTCETNSGGYPEDSEMGMVAGSDNYVDICVGRFPAETAAQVTTMVNKVIHYESSIGQPFWKGVLGIGSAEGAGSGDDGEMDKDHINIILENKLKPKGWTSLYTAYDPGATAAQVTSALNSGVQVINYCGHGSISGWGTTAYIDTTVNALANGDKLPFIFSVACNNGDYDEGTCFAEAWLRKEGGGAIGVLMATISQPWVPPMIGQDYMNDLLSGGYSYTAGPGDGTDTDHGKIRLGSIIFNGFNLWYAESNSIYDLDAIKTWVYFGDPALLVRITAGPPTANFAWNVSGLQVTFTDKSSDLGTGSVVGWDWNFGDGGAATEKNPIHLYSSESSFTVSLLVRDNDGLTHSLTKTVVTGNQPPVAAFKFATSALQVTFTDESTDSDGAIAAYKWEFGDGTTSGSKNPIHTFPAFQSYEIILTVTDNQGKTGSAKETLDLTLDYCPSQSTTFNYEWIAKVEVGTFVNASASSGFSDFTGKVIDLDQNVNIPVKLTPGFASGAFTENFKLWIDLNKDGDWEDAGEEFISLSGNAAVSGIIIIPPTAVTGQTRMRVSMRYDDTPPICGNFNYGEVEDYTVNIKGNLQKDDFVGSFTNAGLWIKLSAGETWNKILADSPTQIVTGDVNGNGIDDLIGIWPIGLWVRFDNNTWQKIIHTGSLYWIACGDTNGDGRDDMVGSFDIGVWQLDSASNSWSRLHEAPATKITLADFDNDGQDDLLGVWNGVGIWVRYATGNWRKILDETGLIWLSSGDMDGDQQPELLGSWSHGIWSYDLTANNWSRIHDAAKQLTAGNMNGTGAEDLVGIWETVPGAWVRFEDGTWTKINDAQPITFATGKLQ